MQSIINEYYRELQTVEDYVNQECNCEAEAMLSLEEIVAVLNKEEEEGEEENIIRINTQDALQGCKDLLIYIQQEVQGFVVEGHILDSLQELKKKLDSYIKID
nr:8971_t:CDS:1 [Entrophospora candida]